MYERPEKAGFYLGRLPPAKWVACTRGPTYKYVNVTSSWPRCSWSSTPFDTIRFVPGNRGCEARVKLAIKYTYSANLRLYYII